MKNLITLFDRIDYFFDNLNNWHIAILIVVGIAFVYSLDRILKILTHCENEPDIKESQE